MLFGAGYAVLYLPVVLSVIGPVGLSVLENEDEDVEDKKQLETQQVLAENKTSSDEEIVKDQAVDV